MCAMSRGQNAILSPTDIECESHQTRSVKPLTSKHSSFDTRSENNCKSFN